MDFISPTAERLAKDQHWEAPQSDRTTKRHHFRVVSTVEAMERRGAIRQEQLLAFQQLERDITLLNRTPAATSRYGRPSSGPDGYLSLMARKAEVQPQVTEALAALAVPEGIAISMLAANDSQTLEFIGKHLKPVSSRATQIAAAQRTIQTATHKLALHYGLLQHPPNR